MAKNVKGEIVDRDKSTSGGGEKPGAKREDLKG